MQVTKFGCCPGPVRPHTPFGTIWSQVPEAYQSIQRGGTVTVRVGIMNPSME